MEAQNLPQVIKWSSSNFSKIDILNIFSQSDFLINTLKFKIGKGDSKVDQKPTNDLVQTLSLFLEVPNLRDCVSISTVVHATISYLFSRHFPAFSVPRPILKV